MNTKLTIRLGIAQLVNWGVSAYMFPVMAGAIARDLNMDATGVYAGFSLALMTMGLSSAPIGVLTDKSSPPVILKTGAALLAGCLFGISLIQRSHTFFLLCACLGIAMRMCLYETVFAALSKYSGGKGTVPITWVCFIAGFSSSVFWPLGRFLLKVFGWPVSLRLFAAAALATVFLNSFPKDTVWREDTTPSTESSPKTRKKRDLLLVSVLFSTVTALTAFLNSGISAHIFDLFPVRPDQGLIVMIFPSFYGISQSLSRLFRGIKGAGTDPLICGIVALSFASGGILCAQWTGINSWFLVLFALLYGAGSGLFTIVRGLLPEKLYGHREYGFFSGLLLIPSFLGTALAPYAFSSLLLLRSPVFIFGLSAAALGISVLLWLTGKAFDKPVLQAD